MRDLDQRTEGETKMWNKCGLDLKSWSNLITFNINSAKPLAYCFNNVIYAVVPNKLPSVRTRKMFEGIKKNVSVVKHNSYCETSVKVIYAFCRILDNSTKIV